MKMMFERFNEKAARHVVGAAVEGMQDLEAADLV